MSNSNSTTSSTTNSTDPSPETVHTARFESANTSLTSIDNASVMGAISEEEEYSQEGSFLQIDLDDLHLDKASEQEVAALIALRVLVREQINPSLISAQTDEQDHDELPILAEGMTLSQYDLILKNLAKVLDQAPDAGPEMEQEVAKRQQEEDETRGEALLNALICQAGTACKTIRTEEKGVMSKEADARWVASRSRRGAPSNFVLEVAVANESRSLAAKECRWWSESGAALAISVKVNRDGHAFNPLISMFVSINSTDGPQRYSFELGRGSGVGADEEKLRSSWAEEFDNFEQLTSDVDFTSGKDKVRAVQACHQVPDFEPRQAPQTIEVPFDEVLYAACLMRPTVAPPFQDFLENVKVNLPSRLIRTYVIDACFQDEVSASTDTDTRMIGVAETGVAAQRELFNLTRSPLVFIDDQIKAGSSEEEATRLCNDEFDRRRKRVAEAAQDIASRKTARFGSRASKKGAEQPGVSRATSKGRGQHVSVEAAEESDAEV